MPKMSKLNIDKLIIHNSSFIIEGRGDHMKAGAVILAGGKSSRMGQNKALLPIGGLTNIERIKNCLAEVFDDIIIVANAEEPYQFLDLPIVKDKIINKGPLAGIQAGLLAAKHETNLVVACDMPFISAQIAKQLVEQSQGYDAVVPLVKGKHQPLFAVYKKALLPLITACLETDQLRMKDMLNQVKVLYQTEENLLKSLELDDLYQFFYNMNNPYDYEEANRKMASFGKVEGYRHKPS